MAISARRRAFRYPPNFLEQIAASQDPVEIEQIVKQHVFEMLGDLHSKPWEADNCPHCNHPIGKE